MVARAVLPDVELGEVQAECPRGAQGTGERAVGDPAAEVGAQGAVDHREVLDVRLRAQVVAPRPVLTVLLDARVGVREPRLDVGELEPVGLVRR